MTKPFTITGVEKALKKLNKAVNSVQNNTKKGLKEVNKLVKRESKKLTSIDTSVLIRSAFFRTGFVGNMKNKPTGVIGYKAKYAGHVHEMPKDTNWQRPGAENKFLEKAVIRNFSSIINILKRFAGKKPI